MAVLTIWRRGKRDSVAIESDRFTIGRSADNDYEIEDDRTVSRHHVVLERVAGVWFLQDLNAVNGTIVNGRHIDGETELQPMDEIVLGKTRMIFRDQPSRDEHVEAPKLTRKEREVIEELVRPMVCGGTNGKPADVAQIAGRMGTGVSNVKAHLGRIYSKFGINADEIGRRAKRAELARRALAAGVVDLDDMTRAGKNVR
jgi:pSer/pThr/pTyr-binding forkhead associated (FHA) protein